MTYFLICLLNAASSMYTFILLFDAMTEYRVKRLPRFLIYGGILAFFTTMLCVMPIGAFRSLIFIGIVVGISLLFRFRWYNHILLSLLLFVISAISELITTILISSAFTSAAVSFSFRTPIRDCLQ